MSCFGPAVFEVLYRAILLLQSRPNRWVICAEIMLTSWKYLVLTSPFLQNFPYRNKVHLFASMAFTAISTSDGGSIILSHEVLLLLY
jgi:hypothetical protein